MQQVEINESDIPSKERIWDKMYQCRDFEISHFWQKAVFLFGFMSLCFAAYGALVLKVVEIEEDKTASLSYLYQYMLGVSVLGIIISVLWVYMMKGSKAWFEVYEKSIYAIENEIFRWENKKYVMGQWAKRMRSDFGFGFWNTKGGAFSPSKINIVIGWILFVVWAMCGIVSVYNWWIISIFDFSEYVPFMISVLVVCVVSWVLWCVLRTFIKSTPLLPKRLHNKWLLKREWTYKPFLPTIRKKIDDWIENKIDEYEKKGNIDALSFSDKLKEEISELIKKEVELKIIDSLLEEYETKRMALFESYMREKIEIDKSITTKGKSPDNCTTPHSAKTQNNAESSSIL